MKYAILNQKHPDYCEENTRKLELLYKGGKYLADNAAMFIPQEAGRGETAAIYHDRLQSVSYRNYMAKIINDYVADLFSKSFSVVPAPDATDSSTLGEDISDLGSDFYRQFAEDTDLQKHGLSYVLSHVMTEGLITGRAYLGVDFPKVDSIPINLKEEEDSKADRAYTYCVPTMSVIDWDEDQFGRFRYVVLKNESIPRKSILQQRDKRVIQFKVWEKTEQGVVGYSIFEITTKLNREPNKDDECKLIDQGTVSFKDIPILCLYMPDHLWIGGLIGNMAAEHFKRSSSLVFAMNRNLFSIPVYKQGDEIGGGDKPPLSVIAANETRGQSTMMKMTARGFAVIGPNDEISFAEPEGKAYTIIDQQLKELVDAIHAVVNQMGTTVTNMSRDLGRSGLSKMMDNHSKELVLTSYASLIKDFATNLYRLVSEGRNENIKWRCIGMENFKIVDRDQLIAEATQMNAIAIPSKTWKKHYMTNLAYSTAGDVNAAAQLTIKEEIDKAVDAMSDEELVNPPLPLVSPQDQLDKKPLNKKENKNGK